MYFLLQTHINRFLHKFDALKCWIQWPDISDDELPSPSPDDKAVAVAAVAVAAAVAAVV
jgi:hypothetical protein